MILVVESQASFLLSTLGLQRAVIRLISVSNRFIKARGIMWKAARMHIAHRSIPLYLTVLPLEILIQAACFQCENNGWMSLPWALTGSLGYRLMPRFGIHILSIGSLKVRTLHQ